MAADREGVRREGGVNDACDDVDACDRRCIAVAAGFAPCARAGAAVSRQADQARSSRWSPARRSRRWRASCAQPLSARLGQQVIIENRPGAGTSIGVKAAAAMPPDGYTSVHVRAEHRLSAELYPDLGFDPLKAFVPVAPLADYLHVAGDRLAGAAGEDASGIRRLCEGQSRQAQFRHRARHHAADHRRVFQQGRRRRHRHHSLCAAASRCASISWAAAST